MCGCSVDPEKYQRGFPDEFAALWVESLLPDVCIPVLGCGDYTVGGGSPVDRSDEFIVLQMRIVSG